MLLVLLSNFRQPLYFQMLPHVSVGVSNEPEAYWHFQPCAHRHLEQFEVSGFIGLRGQLEVVLCILEANVRRTEGDGI